MALRSFRQAVLAPLRRRRHRQLQNGSQSPPPVPQEEPADLDASSAMEIGRMLELRDANDEQLVASVATYVGPAPVPRISILQAIARHSLFALRNLPLPAIHDVIARAGREILYDPSYHLQRRIPVPATLQQGGRPTRYFYPPGVNPPRDAVAIWFQYNATAAGRSGGNQGAGPVCAVITRPMLWGLACSRLREPLPDTRTPGGLPRVDPATGLAYIPMISQIVPFPTCVDPIDRFLCRPDQRLLVALLLCGLPPSSLPIEAYVTWAQTRFGEMSIPEAVRKLRIAMGVYANAKYLGLEPRAFWDGLAEAWTRILMRLGRIH